MNTSGVNIATVSMKPPVEGDRIPKELSDEIKRRLEVSFTAREQTDIVSTITPPEDLTKIWWPINPITGARQGNPKVWSPDTSTWVDFGALGLPVFQYRKRRNGRQQIASGKGAQVIPFDPIGTENYQVRLTPVFFSGNTYVSIPADMNSFGVAIASQAEGQFTLAFYGSPTGGMSIDWEVTENSGTSDVLGQQ